MADWIAAIFFVIGSLFCLVSAVGVIRFPGLFTRMHATTKAASFGIGWIVLGTACSFGTFSAWSKALLIIFFVFLTVPIAPHLLGRGEWAERKRLEGEEPNAD